MKAIFRTRDGLLALDYCIEVREGAKTIMRFLKRQAPTLNENIESLPQFTIEARKYELRGEVAGVPLYEEV